jgi:hypothetical protein
MLQRLQAAIDSGDLKVINMHKDGDGQRILELFTRPVEKALSELIGDLRLAGHQHVAFHEYKDPHGNRLFAGDAKLRTDLSPFSWPKSKSVSTRFLFPLCCTLMAHFSRKRSQ